MIAGLQCIVAVAVVIATQRESAMLWVGILSLLLGGTFFVQTIVLLSWSYVLFKRRKVRRARTRQKDIEDGVLDRNGNPIQKPGAGVGDPITIDDAASPLLLQPTSDPPPGKKKVRRRKANHPKRDQLQSSAGVAYSPWEHGSAESWGPEPDDTDVNPGNPFFGLRNCRAQGGAPSHGPPSPAQPRGRASPVNDDPFAKFRFRQDEFSDGDDDAELEAALFSPAERRAHAPTNPVLLLPPSH